MRMRKPNRVSRPIRVVQRGTKTTYPGRNFLKEKLMRNRWSEDAAKRDTLSVG